MPESGFTSPEPPAMSSSGRTSVVVASSFVASGTFDSESQGS